MLLLDQHAEARVKSGAQVNQVQSYRKTAQDVTINAASEDDAVSLAGNIQTFGTNNLGFQSSGYVLSFS